METTQPQPRERPRSGYARIRNRHHHLIAEHEALKADHEKLVRQHDALKADYVALEAAFSELKELNTILVSDLRAARQPRGHLPAFLVGANRG